MSGSSSTGKVAIVTGAAQGIGSAIALRLAKDGFHVVISDLERQNEKIQGVLRKADESNPARKHLSVPCDVSQEDQVQKLVDETVNQFGRLDCMVANAGMLIPGPLADIKVEDFRKTMDVNAIGTMFCYRTAAAAMIKCNTAKAGRIIGACSRAGKKGMALHGAYCASKFAVRALTQVAAMEYGSVGITVNAYAPGLVNTELANIGLEVAANAQGISLDEFISKWVRDSTILQRMASPEEIANLVSFLASEESSFMTGQCISIDGGM